MPTFEPGPIFGWPRKETIHRDGDPYLTRWHLLSYAMGFKRNLYLHRFHRSDEDVLHDHPWSFWSLILWGGYREWTREPGFVPETHSRKIPGGFTFPCVESLIGHWYGPLSLLKRPAEWIHRVEIEERLRGRVWTLVWTGPKARQWGFWCPKGWRYYRDHIVRKAETGDGCA